MAGYDFKEYDKSYLYLLDAPEWFEDDTNVPLSIHYQKHKFLRKLFRKHFDAEIVDKRFPPRSKPEAVEQYFSSELASKTEKDLVIIYFHGIGSGNGEDYCWSFQRFPSRLVEAYSVIRNIINSGVDCLLLLDCYIPDRFWDLWPLEEGRHVEILAKGETIELSDGTKKADDPGDFTFQIVATLDKFVKEIDGAFGGYRAPITLPEVLVKNDTFKKSGKEISGRIRRINLQGKKAKRLFVFRPELIRKTHKLRFFVKMKRTEGASETASEHTSEELAEHVDPINDDGGGTFFSDEGLGEMCDEQGEDNAETV